MSATARIYELIPKASSITASVKSLNNRNSLNAFDLSNRSNTPPFNANVSIKRPVPGLIPINRFTPNSDGECEISYPGRGLISHQLYTRVVNTLYNSMSKSTSQFSDASICDDLEDDLTLEFNTNGESGPTEKQNKID